MDASGRKTLLANSDTLVVKVGSRVLSDDNGRLDLERVELIGRQLCEIADAGKRVVLVSSGAVAAGIGKLRLANRPTDIGHLQATAAIGQAHLIQAYEKSLSQHGRHAAQILLTTDDLDNRARYLNLRNTMLLLLEMGAIPIVNENDSVSVEELLTTFGDNDRLAAMVSGLFARPTLVILSDVDGVYDRPLSEPNAAIIETIPKVDERVLQLAVDSKSQLSKGGMASKLKTAQFATRSGTAVIIAGGRLENVLPRLVQGELIGTLFLPAARGLQPKKRWIGFSVQPSGSIEVDQGAAAAIKSTGSSLLAIGITRLNGTFSKGDIISILDPDQQEIARGLTNYTRAELDKIRGLNSTDIDEKLGHCPYEEVIHRDNMAIV